MVNNLSERLLVAFLALEDCRQFRLAAERCCMSQSALSQMIARLEDQLGVRLFNRDTRSVELTTAGERFRDGARRVMAEMKQTRRDLAEYLDGWDQSIAVAALPSLAAQWLPEVLAMYRMQRPQVRIRLFDKGSTTCLHLVREGLVDFALCSDPGNSTEFRSELLLREPFYVICPPQHPLATCAALEVADLAGQTIVHMSRTIDVRVAMEGEWRQLRTLLDSVATCDSGLEVDSLQTVAGLVASGFGIGVFPEKALPQIIRPNLTCIPLAPQTLQRPIFLVQQKSRVLSAAANELCACLQPSQSFPEPFADWRLATVNS